MDGHAFAPPVLMSLKFIGRPRCGKRRLVVLVQEYVRKQDQRSARYRDQGTVFFFINASENAVHRKRGIVKILAKALGDR